MDRMIGIGAAGRVRELFVDAMVSGHARLLPAVAEQARTDAPWWCRYPECQCDRDVPCGPTS